VLTREAERAATALGEQPVVLAGSRSVRSVRLAGDPAATATATES
jgi:hypothetical protein